MRSLFDRHKYLQVVNVYPEHQPPLTPADSLADDRLLDRMSPILLGQDIPLVGERVTPDDNPDLRDSN